MEHHLVSSGQPASSNRFPSKGDNRQRIKRETSLNQRFCLLVPADDDDDYGQINNNRLFMAP